MINLAEIQKKSIISLVVIILLFLNMAIWKNLYIGIFFSCLLFFIFSYFIGDIYFLKTYRPYWNKILGSIFLLAIIIIAGSILYYIIPFNNFTIFFIISILAVGLIFIPRASGVLRFKNSTDKKISIKVFVLIALFLFFECVNFFIIVTSATGEAIRSPWLIIPKVFFTFYFFSTLLLLTIAVKNKKSYITLWLVILHFILSATIAISVYKLGYGFDPIIHQATEKIIAEKGSITPKPLYYTGQYVLVVMLSKISFLSTSIIDIYLVPLLFSFFIPLILYFTFSQVTQKTHFLPFASAAFLMVPFSSFIVTTPQALANFFILIIILLSPIIIFTGDKKWILPLIALSCATLFIHPITGIPAIIFIMFICLLYYLKFNSPAFSILKKFLFLEAGFLACISLPIIFIINSEFSKTLSSIVSFKLFNTVGVFQDTLEFLIPNINNNFNIIHDIAYWYENNMHIFFLLVSALGTILLIRKYKIRASAMYPMLFIIFFINYIILRIVVQFPTLITYEQQNYPNRIFDISFYFLLPIIFFALLYALAQSFKKTVFLRFIIIVFMSFFITSSLYISYPRSDAYHLDRGYNITQTDINTVRYIDDMAANDYVVLANQMTSVAAIREFGFKKYFLNEKNRAYYFYYPIPTGDPLYQYYLDMVYKNPSKITANEAGKFIGVQNVYFVLSSYWDKFEELTEKAKKEADSWQSIDQDKAFVFYYDLSKK